MEKIQARMIVEILGRPKEHVTLALNELLKKLSAEKGIRVIESKVHEPVTVKEAKDLFTTFAEIEIEFETLANYMGIMFAYMPSNIEITYPEKLKIDAQDMSSLGNTLLNRLHGYDALAKRLLNEREILIGQINNLRGGVPMPPQNAPVSENKEVKQENTNKKNKKNKKQNKSKKN